MAFASKKELINTLWEDWSSHSDKVEESIVYKYFQKIKTIDTASDNERNNALLEGLMNYGSSDKAGREKLRKK